MTGAEQARALEDYHYLCFNCGTISPWDRFSAWQRDDEDEWRPSEPGESDPMLRCPGCGWEHVDDDSGPGIFDGSQREAEAERERAMADYADHWLDSLADALSDAEAALREAREALRDLHAEVEMAESVGICLPDRVPSLRARDVLARAGEQA